MKGVRLLVTIMPNKVNGTHLYVRFRRKGSITYVDYGQLEEVYSLCLTGRLPNFGNTVLPHRCWDSLASMHCQEMCQAFLFREFYCFHNNPHQCASPFPRPKTPALRMGSWSRFPSKSFFSIELVVTARISRLEEEKVKI